MYLIITWSLWPFTHYGNGIASGLLVSILVQKNCGQKKIISLIFVKGLSALPDVQSLFFLSLVVCKWFLINSFKIQFLAQGACTVDIFIRISSWTFINMSLYSFRSRDNGTHWTWHIVNCNVFCRWACWRSLLCRDFLACKSFV